MERCPVINCDKIFQNKYSLTNHLKRTNSTDHKEYYDIHVKKKNCSLCGGGIDRRSKNQNICYKCQNKAKPVKVIKKEYRDTICFKCKSQVSGYFSRKNTRVLCEKCTDLKIKRKAEYNKSFDDKRYVVANQKRKAIRDIKYAELTERLILLLERDIVEGIKPIHKICKEFNISLKYIRIVAQKVLSDIEYKKRNYLCRQRAGIIEGEKHKERWRKRKRPNSIFFSKKPNKLEEFFGTQIQNNIKNIKIRYNVWKTLKELDKDSYLHLQTDIAINVGNYRVCILCDGEAFHGPNCYFRGNTVKEDEYKSRLLFAYNPFVLRYSESEIKNGFAIEHVKEIIYKIESAELDKIYRSWMVQE